MISIVLMFSLSAMLGGSRTDAFSNTATPIRRSLSTTTTCRPFTRIRVNKTLLFSSPEDYDDDDDGWGSPAAVGESNFDRDQKVRELRSLREEASNQVASPSPSPREASDPAERDLFIPIMAIVSLAGLFGAYGYETLRLASRGELYLPF